MKKITLVVIESAVASTVSIPLDIFFQVDWFWNQIKENGQIPRFQVELVTMDGRPIRCHNQITFHPQRSISEIEETDVIMVPVVGSNIVPLLAAHQPICDWLKAHHQKGAVVTGIGTGVFLLAEAGILDGRTATTHWFFVEKFRKMYPHIRLKPERLIIEEENTISSGGNSTYDLPLYLIEKFCGHEFAVLASKFLILDLGRTSQTPYTIFDFQLDHKDTEVLSVQRYIKNNYKSRLSTNVLASEVGLTPRTLQRRFKQATGATPLVYLQRYRTEIAKRMLEKGNQSFEEIAYHCGYESVGFFRKIFKQYTGLSPFEYRRKY